MAEKNDRTKELDLMVKVSRIVKFLRDSGFPEAAQLVEDSYKVIF